MKQYLGIFLALCALPVNAQINYEPLKQVTYLFLKTNVLEDPQQQQNMRAFYTQMLGQQQQPLPNLQTEVKNHLLGTFPKNQRSLVQPTLDQLIHLHSQVYKTCDVVGEPQKIRLTVYEEAYIVPVQCKVPNMPYIASPKNNVKSFTQYIQIVSKTASQVPQISLQTAVLFRQGENNRWIVDANNDNFYPNIVLEKMLGTKPTQLQN